MRKSNTWLTIVRLAIVAVCLAACGVSNRDITIDEGARDAAGDSATGTAGGGGRGSSGGMGTAGSAGNGDGGSGGAGTGGSPNPDGAGGGSSLPDASVPGDAGDAQGTTPDASHDAPVVPSDARSEEAAADAPIAIDASDARDGGRDAGPDVVEGGGPLCGNGVREGSEQCDLGASNNTGAYDGCNSNCTFGPRCGDGAKNGPEGCDNGAGNGMNLGNCNPDCTGTVQKKKLYVYPPINSMLYPGTMKGNGGVADADAICAQADQTNESYKAFIVDGTNRVATVTAFKGDGQVNWIVRTWTQYISVKDDGTDGPVVWTTDRTALLGIRNGAPTPLLSPIRPDPGGDEWYAWGGMQYDYRTGSDCANWTSETEVGSIITLSATFVGPPPSMGPAPTFFPNSGAASNCGSLYHVLCVQQ